MLDYLEDMAQFTAYVMLNPLGGDWRAELETMITNVIKRETLDIRKDIYALKATSLIGTESLARGRTATYAAALRYTPGPAYYLSAHGSNTTPGVSLSELARDREITIRLGDTEGVAHFCLMKSLEIKERAKK
ncbi:uncharacterized protein N7511_000649 [Penicillium nucicola]|uniref:uncharacterized protein n=1 Tax=Penicillium nucicola TaxID=1850975 RepID=UPI00254556A4|nr:uncharacterized protein N7511_000649 [Penicillium nucicola]KAJ5775638.1 hypothetical protein N7511_000649 [Penicillium nucicola]